jgi:hypothetical protein
MQRIGHSNPNFQIADKSGVSHCREEKLPILKVRNGFNKSPNERIVRYKLPPPK